MATYAAGDRRSMMQALRRKGLLTITAASRRGSGQQAHFAGGQPERERAAWDGKYRQRKHREAVHPAGSDGTN
ncbi:hypothetical protein BCV69DRAFT_43595 [Microstroma glucosiphilum]|uniref:Uncharacterized protein n=1 Tax=Pseudomicrostroma glucosiphilum TaxID=1684307 RepID=A0A316U2N3_9BASI|nr:hypothetical protein BCV69DRAFT_43595 [Pseudomicrostroma glucosiphilum]PWN19576.1 hypothetical protein BCV69DRAFT_43595 [Pseudomicrostroma glucosiphilum]